MNLAAILDPKAKIPGEVIPGRWGYRRMPKADYLAFPAVSRSLLDYPTMSQMYRAATAVEDPNRNQDATTIGDLAHLVTLEPEALASQQFVMVTVPVNPKTGFPYGKDCAAGQLHWTEAVNRAAITDPGKQPVTEHDWNRYIATTRMLRQSVLANPEAVALLNPDNIETEVTGIFWHEDWKCWVKFRPDILPKRRHDELAYWMGDVKTTRRAATDREFRKDCYDYGYFWQDVCYSDWHDRMLPEALRGFKAFSVSNFVNIVLSKPDASWQEHRDAECRVFTIPIECTADGKFASEGLPMMHGGKPWNQELYRMDENRIEHGPVAALYPNDGMSRAVKFVSCLRQFLAEKPDPGDWMAMRRIWPMHEDQPAVQLCR